jgi:tetratricopeptide (TPR) repeat protein
MARPLFEQYKEALRRGHLALLGGELEAALAAYREAADLVPDRPLPHASMGTVLGKLGRRDEALAAFDRALAIAPADEATLRAREDALQEGAPAAAPGLAAVAEAPREPGGEDAAVEARPAIDLPASPPTPLLGPPPDPALLQAEADAAVDAGDPATARDRLLHAIVVHRGAGRLDAALDAGLQALATAPGDPGVHLAIANLQLDRGWRAVASEKVQLLLRLSSLAGDAQAEADARRLAVDRLGAEAVGRSDARRLEGADG